ncbi:DUF721 domain-containing protein [Denitrobaculum tricleocarpae]|uniref:DUF721 domain-containing protein n=1 Tax=Denitrobaculum tricleocarpae TaxID=2591009 RepID=A0A545U219_9PROT|nr:DciA family protein [Denitrobaculum tricleocarpae]TQV83496.1 DUF721 domain-containing protein [Denitrobaculum tricleocarpae]
MTASRGKDSKKADAKRAVTRAKRRGGSPKALAQALPAITKRILGKRGLAEGSLISDWSSIVGEEVARRCIPKQLAFKRSSERREGTLTLRVESGFATELVYLEQQLLERINAHFGYRAVAKLKLLQGPVIDPTQRTRSPLRPLAPSDKTALEAKLADVEDEDLRKALSDLGAAVFSRPKS